MRSSLQIQLLTFSFSDLFCYLMPCKSITSRKILVVLWITLVINHIVACPASINLPSSLAVSLQVHNFIWVSKITSLESQMWFQLGSPDTELPLTSEEHLPALTAPFLSTLPHQSAPVQERLKPVWIPKPSASPYCWFWGPVAEVFVLELNS